MSTTTKNAIRESNQQAIGLSSEWIQRLREVQTLSNGVGKSELPEIVVASIPHVQPSTASSHSDFPQGPHFLTGAKADSPPETSDPSSQTQATTSPTEVPSDNIQPFDPKSNVAIPALPLDALSYAITSQLDFKSTDGTPQSPQPGDPMYRDGKTQPAPNRPVRPQLQSGVPKFDIMKFLGQFLSEDHLVQASTETGRQKTESHVPTSNSESSAELRPIPQTNSDDIGAEESEVEAVPEKSEKAIQIEVNQRKFKLDDRKTMLRMNRVIDRILEKIPPVNSTSIAFVDPSGMTETSLVAIQCATGLARRDLGPILLIDADTSDQMLSRILCPSEQTGFQQVLKDQATWQACTYPTSIEGVHFLPAGKVLPTTMTTCNAILKILTEIKSTYRYVCICGSSLEQQISQFTASACDATYLVVDLHTSDQTEVKDTVRKLGDVGARTLGCISAE